MAKKVRCELLDEDNKGTGKYIYIPEDDLLQAMQGWKMGVFIIKPEEAE